jgi:hypothetical protein
MPHHGGVDRAAPIVARGVQSEWHTPE